jgi:GNAT superfamily N-acetyltransferase
MAIRGEQRSLIAYALGGVRGVVREKGLRELGKRLLSRLRWKPQAARLVVMGHPDLAGHEFPALQINLEMKRVTADDQGDLEEITAIDEWKTSLATSLRFLREGWRCYVAKHEGRIVAVGWASTADPFVDPWSQREFTFASDETYFYRGYCVPEFRGKGAIRFLIARMAHDLARSAGKTRSVTLVRASNAAMRRGFRKSGWAELGRAGFVDLFGVRLHYLRGRRALPRTRRRLFLQLLH